MLFCESVWVCVCLWNHLLVFLPEFRLVCVRVCVYTSGFGRVSFHRNSADLGILEVLFQPVSHPWLLLFLFVLSPPLSAQILSPDGDILLSAENRKRNSRQKQNESSKSWQKMPACPSFTWLIPQEAVIKTDGVLVGCVKTTAEIQSLGQLYFDVLSTKEYFIFSLQM